MSLAILASSAQYCYQIPLSLIVPTHQLVTAHGQAHGAMGLCQDTPLFAAFAGARFLRLADGPDEVSTVRENCGVRDVCGLGVVLWFRDWDEYVCGGECALMLREKREA